MCTTVPLGLDGTGLESSLEGVRFRSRPGLDGCCLQLAPAAMGSGLWQESCGTHDGAVCVHQGTAARLSCQTGPVC